MQKGASLSAVLGQILKSPSLIPMAKSLLNTNILRGFFMETYITYSSQNLDNVANAIRSTVIQEDDEVFELLASELNKSPSLAKRLFPSELEIASEKITVERIRSLAAKKDMMMDSYFKLKIEMARAEGEALLAANKTHLITDLTRFVTAKIDEMDNNILESRSKVMKKMLPHLQELEEYKDFPMLYEPAKVSVSNQIKNYMDTVDELLNSFRLCLKNSTTESHSDFGRIAGGNHKAKT